MLLLFSLLLFLFFYGFHPSELERGRLSIYRASARSAYSEPAKFSFSFGQRGQCTVFLVCLLSSKYNLITFINIILLDYFASGDNGHWKLQFLQSSHNCALHSALGRYGLLLQQLCRSVFLRNISLPLDVIDVKPVFFCRIRPSVACNKSVQEQSLL